MAAPVEVKEEAPTGESGKVRVCLDLVLGSFGLVCCRSWVRLSNIMTFFLCHCFQPCQALVIS